MFPPIIFVLNMIITFIVINHYKEGIYMTSLDIMNILRKQLDCLLETARFLHETYCGDIPPLFRYSPVDVAMYSFIPDMRFAMIDVTASAAYAIRFCPVVYPARGMESFGVYAEQLRDTDYETAMEIYRPHGCERVILINTSHVIRLFSEVFVIYLNSQYTGGPKFGEPNRQIDFAMEGATENAAWYHQFKINLSISLSSFAKAASDIMYDYGIHKVARPSVRLTDDSLHVDIKYFDMQGRPVYVQPKITK